MTAFNKNRPRPKWLDREHENKNTRRGQRYYRHLWNAQPAWADTARIRYIYREARLLRQSGQDVEVDHVFPLLHPLMCGLHIPSNLRIVQRSFNAWKSNKRFRDHPQLELFEECDPFWRLQQPQGK